MKIDIALRFQVKVEVYVPNPPSISERRRAPNVKLGVRTFSRAAKPG